MENDEWKIIALTLAIQPSQIDVTINLRHPQPTQSPLLASNQGPREIIKTIPGRIAVGVPRQTLHVESAE